MIAFLEWQQDIEQWRGGMEERMESVEEIARLVPEILERLGPVTLTAEHQQTVQASVKHLHDLAGIPFATIYSDPNASFHVPRYSEIPDACWLEVAEWFRVRIQVIEKRKSSS
ncbi:MAG TPA: hypothetical protein VGP82_08590 [Ktedonobacterales bacterium]|nr:hypothetical protein [Ktedonobacterales bacterium]